jgi:hypothetical protein
VYFISFIGMLPVFSNVTERIVVLAVTVKDSSVIKAAPTYFTGKIVAE